MVFSSMSLLGLQDNVYLTTSVYPLPTSVNAYTPDTSGFGCNLTAHNQLMSMDIFVFNVSQ